MFKKSVLVVIIAGVLAFPIYAQQGPPGGGVLADAEAVVDAAVEAEAEEMRRWRPVAIKPGCRWLLGRSQLPGSGDGRRSPGRQYEESKSGEL